MSGELDNKDERRITIRLSGEARDAVEALAKMRSTSINEVIRRAIGTEIFLMEAQERGGKILIQDKDGTRQLVLR
jgi:hypothetical protein